MSKEEEALLYQSPDPTQGLWDTWLFQDVDTFHLFHLQRHHNASGCWAIGHAVTTDWLNWETLPLALKQGKSKEWDAGPLMTGMTIKHAGQFYMFYGAMVDRVQRIGVAVSDDLIHWSKSDYPILEAAAPYYETNPSHAINYETAWRDPYIFFNEEDNYFYAFICARAAYWETDVGGGCIAVAQSENLLDWKLLPPAFISESITCLEVPEHFLLNGKHYLTYTTNYHFGTPYPVHNIYQSGGTFYLESDNLLTGYSKPAINNTLMASAPPALSSYVGRSINDSNAPNRRYYYYHNIIPPNDGENLCGSLSAIKYLNTNGKGGIYLSYAPLLETHTQQLSTIDKPLSRENSLYLVDENISDGIYEITVNVAYAGLCFRVRRNNEENLEGLAVWLSPESQEGKELWVVLGSSVAWAGPNGERMSLGGPLALSRLENTTPTNRHLRIVLHGSCVDVYVDNQLCISHTLSTKKTPPTYQVGAFYVGFPKEAAAESLKIQIFNQ